MTEFNMDEVIELLKEKQTSPKKEYALAKLEQFLSQEDLCYLQAGAFCQSIVDDAKGDLDFILDKYVFYENLYIAKEDYCDDGSNQKLIFLRELCAFLEKHIVWLNLEHAGYERDISDDFLRWKKGVAYGKTTDF